MSLRCWRHSRRAAIIHGAHLFRRPRPTQLDASLHVVSTTATPARRRNVTRRIQVAAVITFAWATIPLQAALDRQDAASSETVTITGCVQRMHESGTLGPPI